MSQPTAPALIITGMHRSGTSLAASLVASAGVHLGERLMGPGRGNVKGHFEDLDFYELHQLALTANGLGCEGFSCQQSIVVPPAIGEALDALVERRRGGDAPWGWKDPRTTLFLEMWRDKLPEARFLLVFRRPWEVMDSLYRRGDQTFTINPRLALDIWLAYNRRIHDFYLAHHDRCLLVETARVCRDPVGVIAAAGRLMGVELPRPDDRYDPALLVEDSSCGRVDLVHGMRAEACGLYETLRELAGEPAAPRRDPPRDRGPSHADDSAQADRLIDAAAMQWARAARAEQLGHCREAELATTAQLLAATQAERDHLANGLAQRTAEHEVAAREVVMLREQLLRARHRKTIGERLTLESRRILRQACRFVGLTGPAAMS
ncbi:MAG: hypothetical protein WCJ18_02365 [Planctomycetota bacterium]